MNDLDEVGVALGVAPKPKAPYTKEEARRRLQVLLTTLAVIAFAAAVFVLGALWSREFAYHQLPDCEEDEVLYPAGDFSGRGKNSFSDYECIHIEDL